MESNIEQQAELVQEQGFAPTTDIDYKKLPSQGKNYPYNSTISVRPYSFGEVKRISDSQLSTSDKLATIVSGINTSFDKGSLTYADITYLGMVRKLNTIGTLKAKYPYNCPNCGSKQEHIFSQQDIEIADLDVEALPITIEMSDGNKYEFGPIDYKNMLSIDRGEFDRHIAGKSTLKDKMAVYALLCKNRPFPETYKFFSTTTKQDDHDVLNFIDDTLSHDIKPLTSKCSECRTEVFLPLRNAVDLVLPFRDNERSIRDRVSFGKGTVISRN
jgi:hypothetical protein